jgi:hypothetical protein
MKSKKINKRLVLNKKTISDLSDHAMNEARGGSIHPVTTCCPTTFPKSCPAEESVCLCPVTDTCPPTFDFC